MIMEWQPIETAPKDGTEVLLFYPRYRQGIFIGHFDVSVHMSHGKETYRSEKWWNGGYGGMFGKEPEPTHWMPLPSPPRDTRSDEE
jgi:hypothetical protein